MEWLFVVTSPSKKTVDCPSIKIKKISTFLLAFPDQVLYSIDIAFTIGVILVPSSYYDGVLAAAHAKTLKDMPSEYQITHTLKL